MSKKSIDDFKAALSRGGIRPTMFEVQFSIPESLTKNSDIQFNDIRNFTMLAKAAQVPGETLTTVSVGLPGGGALKLPGSRVYDAWQCTVITDDNMRLRSLFEYWSERIISREGSERELDQSDYYSVVTIRQLSRDGLPVRDYKLHYAYPTAVSGMELSYEADNMLSEYTISWNYHYFTGHDARREDNEKTFVQKNF